jgi:hypothetical protein
LGIRRRLSHYELSLEELGVREQKDETDLECSKETTYFCKGREYGVRVLFIRCEIISESEVYFY